jgi:SAM-dependent methyltransferase
MKGFVDLAYRLPFAEHYKDFDRGFYVDFPRQLKRMGVWLQEYGCRRTLDIGAMTGGCIEYISGLGIRMDGVQFTQDVKRLAARRLKKAGIVSTLYVSPVHAELRVPGKARYDGIVSLGWFNLPFSPAQLKRTLRRIHGLLRPGGIFMFDFFEFKNVVVTPTEAQRVGRDVFYLSRSERLGSLLRRTHVWVLNRRGVFMEHSDLVDRSAREARSLLAASGFEVLKTEALDLNYPRQFWLVRRV